MDLTRKKNITIIIIIMGIITDRGTTITTTVAITTIIIAVIITAPIINSMTTNPAP